MLALLLIKAGDVKTSTSPVLDKTPEPRVPLIHALTATTPHTSTAGHPRTLTLSQTTTVHASQSPQQPHAQHRVLRQPHKQTKDYHRTTNTTQTHRPSSKSERNLIILQVNINGLRNKLEDLKLLIHDTHADIITIQETKLTSKAKTPKIHNFTSVRTDRLHKAGGGLFTLIRDNITFTTTDIPSTINTHNTELQMVMVHINNTKHITIANIYIPPRDTTSTHYKTADTDIQHCIQYITNIPHSVLTGDVNARSTLWHSYTDYHRGQLIANVISNSDHITLNTNTPTRVPNTNTPTRVPNTTLQQTSSPRCLTHFTTGHRGQLNTHYHQTTCPYLPQLTYDMTTDYNKTDGLLPSTRKQIGHNLQKTQSPLSLRPPYPPTYTLPTEFSQIIILMADKQNIPKGKMHSNCRLLPEDIVCKITQRNNIRRANTGDPALKLLNEEITSDIQKHKQNIWKEHLDAHWDHRHNTHTLWKTIHGLSNRAPSHTLNTSITFNNKIATTPTLFLPTINKYLIPAQDQHGFRREHLTTSALLQLTTDIAVGFNQRKPPDRTVCVAEDISAAFDTVCHNNLSSKINRFQLPPATARWLSCYMRGRQANTCFRGVKSTSRKVNTGSKLLSSCSAFTLLTCRYRQIQSSGSATLLT